MKVVFMGTPDFSVGTLEALVEAGYEIHRRCDPAGQTEGPRKTDDADTGERGSRKTRPSGLSAAPRAGCRGDRRDPENGAGCDRCRCIRPDYSKRDFGHAEIRMHQRSCIPCFRLTAEQRRSSGLS